MHRSPTPFALLALFFVPLVVWGCPGSLQLTGAGFDDDDDTSADDDDSSGDDDDAAGDDDDATDDDDAAGDDDDAAGDDDDATDDDDDDDATDDDDASGDDDDTTATPFACADEVIQCGDTIIATTVGRGNDSEWYSCNGAGNNGPDIYYEFVAPEANWVQVSLSPDTADLELFLLAGDQCDPSDCEDASLNGETEPESLGFMAEPGSNWVIVVDGYDGAESTFTLSVTCGDVDGVRGRAGR